MSNAQYWSSGQTGLMGVGARKPPQTWLTPPVPASPIDSPPAPPVPVGLLPAEPPGPVGLLPAEPVPGPLPVPAVQVVLPGGHSSPTTTPAQPLGAIASGASKSTDQSAVQGRCCVSFDD